MTGDKEKIAKLMRLIFSSDKDGEVLAAVKALQRILKANNSDCHELAATVTGKIMQVVKEVIIEREVDTTQVEADKWINAADKILEGGGLQEHELKFVKDMRERFVLSPFYKPSDKQVNWFRMLYNRVA